MGGDTITALPPNPGQVGVSCSTPDQRTPLGVAAGPLRLAKSLRDIPCIKHRVWNAYSADSTRKAQNVRL